MKHRIFRGQGGRLIALPDPINPSQPGFVFVREAPFSPSVGMVKIRELETRADRMLREAVLGHPGAMETLRALDGEIEALRSCLTNK